MIPTIIFWLILGVGVIILDVITSSFLFVWFSIGAVASIIAALIGLTFPGQFLIFGVVSLVSIVIGYPWAKKKFKDGVKRTKLMEEEYIGKVFVAEEEVVTTCRFKVSGVYWTGENKGAKINKGQKFLVKGIDGNKLIIEGIGEE